MDIRTYLDNEILLFDGGMGTYLSMKTLTDSAGCELANLSNPEIVAEIHREYLEVGARAIKTNTFGMNRVNFKGEQNTVEKCIRAGYELAAKEAEAFDAYVFADIGPVSQNDDESQFEEYCYLADIFLDMGAKHFLFETLSNTDGLIETAKHIKSVCPDAYIITSFAVDPDGYSRDGIMFEDLLGIMSEAEEIDAVGLNCVCGAGHILRLLEKTNYKEIARKSSKKLSIMPNAGYPIVINNRSFYEGDPDYYASHVIDIVKNGARIIGGCCGTTPVHIQKIYEQLKNIDNTQNEYSEEKAKNEPFKDRFESPFWSDLSAGKKVIAVELDSPSNAELAKFMSGAWELKDAGADIITIADCPIARARMDSSMLACKIRRELNIDALPHMTCRDRNLNATKALLLGDYAEGIRNVLLVTGDPIPSAERDEVKSVYQFNSRKLAAFVTSLGRNELPGEFHIFGALNVNARNFNVQLDIAKDKVKHGMVGFLTQPILTPQAMDNLKLARAELDAYILGGVIPVVSERNAIYMNNEINGIKVDEKVIEMYKGKTREEGETLATEISVEIMRRICDFVDGFYLMTPFGRTSLISRIIKEYNNI